MRKFDPSAKRSFNSNNKFKHKRFRRHDRTNEVQGTAVALRDGEHPEALIRRFKKLVELSGIMKELKRREFYLSPSQKRKDKRKRALKRARKEAKRSGFSATDRE